MGDDCRLILGDCLTLMRAMPDASIDAVVTDPPYGQSNESYDRGVDPEVWRECFRLAKPDSCLISFAGSPTYHRIASDIESAGWKVRQMWGWVYRDGMITSAYPKEGFDRLAPAFDPICFATKGRVLLNLEREGEPWHKLKADGSPRGRGMPNYSARQRDHGAVRAGGHWPKAIVSDGVEPFEYFAYRRAQAEPDATDHPNQKPLALMEWIVSKLPEGATVLDPYAGSTTTGKACLNLGRKFIGMEINPEYHAIGEARLAAARASTPLFQTA